MQPMLALLVFISGGLMEARPERARSLRGKRKAMQKRVFSSKNRRLQIEYYLKEDLLDARTETHGAKSTISKPASMSRPAGQPTG